MATKRNLLPDIRDALLLSLPDAEAQAWCAAPNPALDGKCPLDVMRAGEFEAVYAAALAI